MARRRNIFDDSGYFDDGYFFEDDDYTPQQAEVPPNTKPGGGDTVYRAPTASEQINAQNPDADPSKPYVQEGDTGGYLEGIGVTVAPGRSITSEQAQKQIEEALAAGVPQSWIDDFLLRNAYDTNRLIEAYFSDRPGDSGGGDGGGGGGGGGGSAFSLDDILRAFGNLGQQYGGPGNSGVFPEDVVQQVGQDPLSQLITGAYVDLIGNQGTTQLGSDVEATLRGLLEQGGALDPERLALRFEQQRELIDRARRAQLNQATAQLAARGLLSEPGIPQGVEAGTIGRIEEALAPIFSGALRDVLLAEQDAAEERLQNALALATGFSQQQSRTLLDTLRDATDRQRVLSEIALATLDRNVAWNRFLAEFGLNRDVMLNELREGRMQNLIPLVQMFLNLAQLSRGGYV